MLRETSANADPWVAEIALDTRNQWLKSIDLATVWRPREAFHRPSKVGIAQEKINDR